MLDLLGLLGHSPAPADAARLRRIESKLDLILKHLGIEHVEGEGDLPADARELANLGDRIGAIKAYRAATGAGLAESAQAVDAHLTARR